MFDIKDVFTSFDLLRTNDDAETAIVRLRGKAEWLNDQEEDEVIATLEGTKFLAKEFWMDCPLDMSAKDYWDYILTLGDFEAMEPLLDGMYRDFIYIEKIHVEEKYRRRSVMTKLLDDLHIVTGNTIYLVARPQEIKEPSERDIARLKSWYERAGLEEEVGLMRLGNSIIPQPEEVLIETTL